MTIHRMRTVRESVEIIREMDAQSAVTANCIRTLCKEGKVHCVLAGTKVLVDLDHLLEYLSGSLEKSSENAQELA
ncbi:MAG TPA: DNA-binding protein [Clostridia bacterium]|nr:DNA-binding protein [Clostridia bacterium]